MQMAKTLKAPSDRTLKRLMVGMAAVLVIGIPLIGVLYFMDQYRDAGPSLPDRAIQAAEDAVRKNPNSVDARFALAEYYSARSRYPEAIAQYDEILKAQPKAVAVLLGRGRAEVKLDKLDAGAADFQAVVDALKDTETANSDKNLQAAYYELGGLEMKRNQPKKAIGLLTTAIAMNRTDADALYLLGTALIASGDPDTGISATQRAIDLVPTGWCDPYAQLASAYGAKKDTAGVQYATGMVAFCEGRVTDAKAQLTPLVSGPYALQALIGLGLLGEQQGDTVAATDAYQKVLAKDPQNFSAITGMNRLAAVPHGTSASSGDASPAPSSFPAASN